MNTEPNIRELIYKTRKKINDIIKRTRLTNNEHGFVICKDDSTTNICIGDRCSIKDFSVINQCYDRQTIPYVKIHTHPSNNKFMSDKDIISSIITDVEYSCIGGIDNTINCFKSPYGIPKTTHELYKTSRDELKQYALQHEKVSESDPILAEKIMAKSEQSYYKKEKSFEEIQRYSKSISFFGKGSQKPIQLTV